MTIDSDSETEYKNPKTGKIKKLKPKNTDDEEILLAHSVILTDTHEGTHHNKKHTTGLMIGSNNLWNFTESLGVEHKRTMAQELNNEETAADERAPFLQTTEERCNIMIEKHKLKLPEELQKFIDDKGTDKPDVEEIPEDPKIHYDKEDLISFH